MKAPITFAATILSIVSSFGQLLVSNLSDLQISPTGINIAELSLIYRSGQDFKDISEIGTQLIVMPNQVNGKGLKMEFYRFRTLEGTSFKIDDTIYVPVHLYYDMETSDPRDDIYLLTEPFAIQNKSVLECLEYYHGQELLTADFKMAPTGEPSYRTGTVRVEKKE